MLQLKLLPGLKLRKNEPIAETKVKIAGHGITIGTDPRRNGRNPDGGQTDPPDASGNGQAPKKED